MGQLLKILIIAIAISVVLLALRKMLTGRRGKSEEAQTPAVQSMTKCAHCGTFLPESQALFDGEKPYCNEEHRRLASGK